MDRAMISQHLAQAERHVSVAIIHVERQHLLVSELTEHRHSEVVISQATWLLSQLEAALELHRADRDRLWLELSKAAD
jgi:hypothetical protein